MTDIVNPPTISSLPAAPLPTDTPTAFNTKSFALLGALDPLVTQINAVADATEQNATAANERAVSANSAKGAAESAASAANADALRLASLDALWLGAAAADPTTGRAGAALVAGNAYVNSGTGLLRTYNGTAWVNALNVTAGVTSVNGSGGAVTLKTVAGQSLLGSGDVAFKTINGNSIEGAGNIVLNSGAVDFLGEVTANGAASADITGLDAFGATHSHLFVVAENVNLGGSSGTEIRAFFQNNGAWASSSYQYSTETRVFTAAPVNAQSNSATFIPICPSAAGISLTPGDIGTSILVNIYNPSLLLGGRIDWYSFGTNSSLAYNSVRGSAMRYPGPQALQGIRFAPSTGTMFGVFRLYGIRKS